MDRRTELRRKAAERSRRRKTDAGLVAVPAPKPEPRRTSIAGGNSTLTITSNGTFYTSPGGGTVA